MEIFHKRVNEIEEMKDFTRAEKTNNGPSFRRFWMGFSWFECEPPFMYGSREL